MASNAVTPREDDEDVAVEVEQADGEEEEEEYDEEDMYEDDDDDDQGEDDYEQDYDYDEEDEDEEEEEEVAGGLKVEAKEEASPEGQKQEEKSVPKAVALKEIEGIISEIFKLDEDIDTSKEINDPTKESSSWFSRWGSSGTAEQQAKMSQLQTRLQKHRQYSEDIAKEIKKQLKKLKEERKKQRAGEKKKVEPTITKKEEEKELKDVELPDALLEQIINYEFGDDDSGQISRKDVLKSVLEPIPKKKKDDKKVKEEKKGVKTEQLDFLPGMYVEYLHTDGNFHLEPVRRIVKVPKDEQPPEGEEPEEESYFNIGSATKLFKSDDLRASEEGLKLVFGFRPWIWQQWAMLQIENQTRFADGHQDDFQKLSFKIIAKDFWDKWMNNPRNLDFKIYVEEVDMMYPGSKDKLVDHILSPFNLMDDISSKPEWKLGEGVNVFMYCSIFGSGFLSAFAVLIIQLLVPSLLLKTAISNSPGSNRFVPTGNITGWNLFCSQRLTAIDGKIMNIAALLLYAIRIMPDLMYNLFLKNGASEEAPDRLNEIRKLIFENGDDTAAMQLGFKLQRYINGVYVTLILTILLFILFLTDDIFSIILNALALEFVYTLDETLAQGKWFDPGFRFLQAGAVEMVIRNTLNANALVSYENFKNEYDVEKIKMLIKPSGTFTRARLLFDPDQAKKDNDENSRFLSATKKMNIRAARYIKERAVMSKSAKSLALWNYTNQIVQFGTFDQILVNRGITQNGIFSRFYNFNCWSKWDKVLFVAPIPCGLVNGVTFENTKFVWKDKRTVDHSKATAPVFYQIPARNKSVKPSSWNQSAILNSNSTKNGQNIVMARFSRLLGNLVGQKAKKVVLNFSPERSQFQAFMEDMRDILLFEGLFRSIGLAIRRKEFISLPIRILDGFLDWFSYLYQLIFPFILVFFLYLVIACY